jgi:3-oxoacyl-[acyl-carrier protein] reductase
MPGDFQDKVVLVTGGSGGIGAETSRRFAAGGAKVAVHYGRNAASAEAVVAEIKAAGGEAIAVGGDVADEAQAKSIVDAVVKAFGGIDILVNNAGISLFQPFGSITTENFTTEFNANVLGVIVMMQAVVPHFPDGGGRVVNVSSNLCYGPFPGLTVYTASKSAVIALTQGFARELGAKGIAVNAVAPGVTDTPMTAWLSDDDRKGLAAAAPLGRIAQPDDVADAILFLASPAARWVTGRTMIVDGGLI